MRLHAVVFHSPLKNREHDDEKDRESMLENLGNQETFPEPIWTERPVLGIGTKEEKHSETEKDKRPHFGPCEMFASREEGEKTGQQDKDAGPTVVVLGPRNVRGSIDAKAPRPGNEGGRELTALGLGASADFVAGPGELLEVRAGESGHPWGVTSGNFVQRDTVLSEVDSWRLRRQ